jgi:membrane associated rhomboid family serine protease
MTPTSVGMRCPECARQKTKVRTAATLTRTPQLTYALIAINVIVFVAQIASGGGLNGLAGPVYENGALAGQPVADGEWWRIITFGFLHAGLLHILFNTYVLYFLGALLEPEIGKLRFGLIYGVSLVGGALGALLTSLPNQATVGASGAVFGLMSAAFVALRARGIDPMQTGIGVMILLNLGITFLIPNISIGAHVGGLIAGGVVAYLLFEIGERRRGWERGALAASAVLGVALAVAAVAVSP